MARVLVTASVEQVSVGVLEELVSGAVWALELLQGYVA